jgi:transcription initiation factor TFIID subunit 1
MMGSHPGALSKAKIRVESDLSPTEGNLILVEYSEERPPIFLSKGMSSKIVNYYRGDKAHCPVSAGGGDRPARRKRDGEGGSKDASQNGKERLPRLAGSNRKISITDWVGKLPKRSQKERSEQEAIDILPEGVTEILHPKQHGPFLGDIDEGATVTGMVSNLFVAPMFRHESESTDFLMILNKMNNTAGFGERDVMGVVLRDFPPSVYTVGQTEPRARVHAPNSTGEKNFLGPWTSYQIARALTRSQASGGGGLTFEELHNSVLPNLDIQGTTLRQRLKQVAEFDKNTQIWTTKPIGCDDYQGLEALGNDIPPEGEACFDSARAASRRLSDLGLNQLVTGVHSVASVGLTFVYLVSQLNTVRELTRKTKKLAELGRSNKTIQPSQLAYYEKAASELDFLHRTLRQKHEIAKFIYEELQLTPWHLTGEFIEVHKKGEGTGMMKLTGLGDPSGQGEGFSFLREVDSKPLKSIGANDALSEQVKKITGTDNDLRKLTMKQMAALLRHYGMNDKYINTLKRWDRVHVIRDLSTKFASDGVGDGLERFARGEKLKLSEQKQMYHDRIQVIWKRQLAALSMDTSDKTGGGTGPGGLGTVEIIADDAVTAEGAQLKGTQKIEKDDESSDSDSDDDDDLAAALEEEMIHRVSGICLSILLSVRARNLPYLLHVWLFNCRQRRTSWWQHKHLEEKIYTESSHAQPRIKN